MKWFYVIIFSISLCFLFYYPVSAQEIESDLLTLHQQQPFELYRFTLENGLKVWCQPRPDSKSVVVYLPVRVGTRSEERANNGISHYLEHMLFTGTERWTENEIKDIISKRGGRWNGWTGREYTTYYAELGARDFDIAIDWIAEVVFHSTFPKNKIDKERNVVFQEKWGKYGWVINTFRRLVISLGLGYDLGRAIEQSIFPDSTLTMGYLWEDEALEKIDRQALLDYYHQYYMPSNAVLIVVGDVRPGQVLEKAEHYFGTLEFREPPPHPETPKMPDSGPHNVVVRGPVPTAQCRLRIGARTVGPTHPDRWPLKVVSEVLENSLYEEIRHEKGLVYGLWVGNYILSDVGYFGIGTRSELDKKDEVQRIIDEHVGKIRQGEIDAQKFAEAQTALKGRWALYMETNRSRAGWLEDWAFVLADDEPVPDYEAMIDTVKPEDLSRVLNTYLTPQRSFVGMHIPILTVHRGLWIVAGFIIVVASFIIYRKRRKKKKQRI